MVTMQKVSIPPAPSTDGLTELRQQYGCGPVEFTGADNELYEWHLLFANVVEPAAATPRDRFEAFARSVSDILAQRWVLTEATYERERPKRVYYLSMEFSGLQKLLSLRRCSVKAVLCRVAPRLTATRSGRRS
jgi:starch phosphorylase